MPPHSQGLPSDKGVFLVHNHGAPNHHKALNQASDYFHDVYGGTIGASVRLETFVLMLRNRGQSVFHQGA